MGHSHATGLGYCALGTLFVALGCSASNRSNFDGGGAGAGVGTGGAGGLIFTGNGGAGGDVLIGDPKTCEQAAQAKTYIGCDFWPTVVPNQVWSIFDFAVVVANAGDDVASVTIERNGGTVASGQVQPDSLATFYLPWVAALKGPDFDMYTSVAPFSASALVTGGAYHLTSSIPVTVYQFNALEYGPQGGPPNKDWSSCPGYLSGVGCNSYSNDASLLLPSTAMTGNFRVTGIAGWPLAGLGAYFAVTGLTDGTGVTVHMPATGSVVSGAGISAIGAGQNGSFTLDRGDVAVLLGDPSGDQSGAQVYASQPVQVLHGHPCRFVPDDYQACDHLEESVLPAETLGKHYLVTRPTGPSGGPVTHVVRLYGNFDGTVLTYPQGAPPGAPPALAAGQVVDLGMVDMDFEVTSDQAFAVSSFLVAGEVIGAGDPAQSAAVAVEQFRSKYVFLAPYDYDQNFAQIVMPSGAGVVLDGVSVGGAVAIGGSGYSVAHVLLGPGVNGAHVLQSNSAIGLQVTGYGSYTSYYYPGGLDLRAIAPPPPPPQ
ncbi:MAG: IgGFc-binding protein [Polyangiaceae bacterium]|nr:IgGFc-binding protein [Polyangiaceae bacterium]